MLTQDVFAVGALGLETKVTSGWCVTRTTSAASLSSPASPSCDQTGDTLPVIQGELNADLI